MDEKELLQAMYSDFKEMKEKNQAMYNDLAEMKSDLAEMKSDLAEVKSDLKETKERVSAIETDVSAIKMTIENEIRVNIQRVAEGHLDLSRNLHEAMKPSNEVEMLAIKVRMLESDMMELKRKIG